MRTFRPVVLALLAAVLIGLTSPAPVVRASAAELTLVEQTQLSRRLVELAFRTPAVRDVTHVRVLLPDDYDQHPAIRYPVLYLLHGGFGGYRDWTDQGDAERLTAGTPMIVVMPDTGPNGGYTDWYNDGRGGPPKWETYHLRQLLPWIDQHFRTVPDRGARAVAGLSMGGGGALGYAARHPDLFVAAASFSGAVDSNSPLMIPVVGADGGRYGSRLTQEVRWRAYNPWDLAGNLAGLDITVRTGNGLAGGPGGDSGDFIESEVHRQSVALHRRLVALDVPHVWDDYGPGGHTWFYWQRDLAQLVRDLPPVFDDPPAPPEPFDFRVVEPEYTVYGWHVRIERPALEFSELLDASRSGFGLRGSGTATVTTPAWYRPGSHASVTLTRDTGAEHVTVRVGADCRIRLPVALGPGSRHQQYTLPDRLSPRPVHTTRAAVQAQPGCEGGAR
jgi:S-formylglutathione hydrolase FrmB